MEVESCKLLVSRFGAADVCHAVILFWSLAQYRIKQGLHRMTKVNIVL